MTIAILGGDKELKSQKVKSVLLQESEVREEKVKGAMVIHNGGRSKRNEDQG